MSGCPTRETTKILYTLQELLLVGNKHDTEGGGDRKQHVLEDCGVRSQLPKTDNDDKTHKNDAGTLS